MSFSQRYGYKPVREIVQLESMDVNLRNGLWSLLNLYCWERKRDNSLASSPVHKNLCTNIWFGYFKLPVDQISLRWDKVLSELRKYFFSCNWFEVFDFLEFVTVSYPFDKKFILDCNKLLEREMSAYRFVDGKITPITNEEEIGEIQQAIDSKVDSVKTHLRRSLELMSDRDSPDYRNSIKESISAVESLVKKVLGVEGGTLGQLIKKLEEEIGLHPSLKKAFSNLYGYTSDEDGIRHALIEENNNDFHDAKFMLVACSAFINYVEGKAESGR